MVNNIRIHGIDNRTTVLLPSPLFHVAGLVCGLLVALAIGGAGVVLRGYSPRQFPQSIGSERVEYCMGVTTHLILAAEQVDQREFHWETFIPLGLNILNDMLDNTVCVVAGTGRRLGKETAKP